MEKRSILSYFITGFGIAKCRENTYMHYGLVDRIHDLWSIKGLSSRRMVVPQVTGWNSDAARPRLVNLQ